MRLPDFIPVGVPSGFAFNDKYSDEHISLPGLGNGQALLTTGDVVL